MESVLETEEQLQSLRGAAVQEAEHVTAAAVIGDERSPNEPDEQRPAERINPGRGTRPRGNRRNFRHGDRAL